MVSTPGLQRVLAAAWARRVQSFDTDGDVEALLTFIAASLDALTKVKDPHDFSEVLDGCGGCEGFCSTLTLTFDHAARHPALSNAVSTVGGACLLLDYMNTVAPDILPYLLSRGFIPTLVSSLGVVGPPSLGQPASVPFPVALASLRSVLCTGLGYPWVEQALQAGLLSQVIAWGSKQGIMHFMNKFSELLEEVLPRTLVYYPLIAEMRRAFSQVESPSSDGLFARSGLYASWNNLKTLSDRRAVVVALWEARRRPSALVCFNLECSKVTTSRDNFRCCSACQTATYCSQACQRADWTDGHNGDCRFHLVARRAFLATGLRHRDRMFLRILLDMDYARLRVPIAMNMVRFMAKKPDTPLLVDFDYTGGTAQVKVVPLSVLDGSEVISPHSQRLARAGGRLVAHAIRIGCVSTTWQTVWPRCASTSELYDGLKEIARTAEGLENAELEPRVLALIEKTAGNGTTEVY